MKRIHLCALLCFSLTCLQASSNTPLTNKDVIEMIKAGIPESTIVAAINHSPNDFDRSVQAIIALKNAGASAAIMDSLLAAKANPNQQAIVPQADSPTESLVAEYLRSKIGVESRGNLDFQSVRKVNGKSGVESGVPKYWMDIEIFIRSNIDCKWNGGSAPYTYLVHTRANTAGGIGSYPGVNSQVGDIYVALARAELSKTENGWAIDGVRLEPNHTMMGSKIRLATPADLQALNSVDTESIGVGHVSTQGGAQGNAARAETRPEDQAAKKSREDAAKALIAAAPPLSETEIKSMLSKQLPDSQSPMQQLAGKENKYTLQHPSTLRFKSAEGQSGYHGWLLFGNEDEITIGGSSSNFINKSKYTLDYCLKQSLERARGSLQGAGQVIEPLAITVDGQEGSLFVVTRVDKGIVVRTAYAVIVVPKKCLVSLTLHSRADRFEEAFMSYRRVLDSLRFRKE